VPEYPTTFDCEFTELSRHEPDDRQTCDLRDCATYRRVDVARGTESDGIPMTKSTKKSGLVVKSTVKAGGLGFNHNRPRLAAGLVVKSKVKVGGLGFNHNRTLLA
jgi:hypothetical protein